MMLTVRGGGGDVEVSGTVRMGGDPIKEVLKQAMLQHEVTFRNQVRELHRLYWTQKNLMRELYLKESKECDRPMAEEKRAYPISTCATMTQAPEIPKHRDRGLNLNLQLSADEFTGDAGREVGNGFSEQKGFLSDVALINTESGERNFNNSQSDGGNGSGRISLVRRGSCSSAPHIINLEEVVEFELIEKSNSVSSYQLGTQTSAGKSMFGPRIPIPSDLVTGSGSLNHSAQEPAMNWPYVILEQRWRGEEKISGIGLNEDGPLIERTSQKQQSTSCKPIQIDLNANVEDDSNYVRDTVPAFSSPATSSTVQPGISDEPNGRRQPLSSWRESDNRCSKEISAAIQSDDGYLASMYTRAKSATRLSCADQISHPCTTLASAQSIEAGENGSDADQHEVEKVGPSSDTVGTTECYSCVEAFSSISSVGLGRTDVNFLRPQIYRDLGQKNVGSATQQVCSVQSDSKRDVEDKQVRQGSEDETVSSNTVAQNKGKEERICKEFFVESKTDHIAENSGCSSPSKSKEGCPILSSAEESGITQMDSLIGNGSSKNQVQSTEAGDHGFLDDSSCIPNQESGDHLKEQKSHATGSDNVISNAAEALICISSESRMYNFGQYASLGLTDGETEGSSDAPQYSSDSFEYMTLMLLENNHDECTSDARPSEEQIRNETCGVKLRRGRGLRDFQKDILPGLVSLSRHEICEDLHNIGYNLRKDRSRNKDNFLVPVRSQRSRRYSAGRRF